MKQTLFFAILAICGLASCDIINPDEDIPAYIHIEPFEFTIGPDQGAGTTRITEGYLFVGPDYLGTYSLPLTVPVLFEGNQPIQVWPGVHDNGVAALPNVYPFYTIYQTELDLVPGNVDTLRPETAYRTDINFLVESFISNSNIFVNDLDNDTTTNLVNTLLDGQPVGRFDLDLDHPQIVDGTIILNELPPRSREMYLELEYRSDVDINIGVQGFDGNGLRIFSGADRGARARDEWTKIYFNLSDYVIALYDTSSRQYLLFFQAILPVEDGQFAKSEATGYFRNLKIITF